MVSRPSQVPTRGETVSQASSRSRSEACDQSSPPRPALAQGRPGALEGAVDRGHTRVGSDAVSGAGQPSTSHRISTRPLPRRRQLDGREEGQFGGLGGHEHGVGLGV
jgi:hypothetical protein